MTTHNAQPERETTGPAPPSRRQMTLGECIAVAELAQRFNSDELSAVGIAHVMKVVDAMRVCTTCGQQERAHGPEHRWAHACTSYAPRQS